MPPANGKLTASAKVARRPADEGVTVSPLVAPVLVDVKETISITTNLASAVPLYHVIQLAVPAKEGPEQRASDDAECNHKSYTASDSYTWRIQAR